MPISGIGGFGAGALEGYDKGLSNYISVNELMQKREAAKRAEQAQALQSLIHGNTLAQTSPDVAERAAANPDKYGVEAGPLQAGAAQSRALQLAEQRLQQALQTGEIDTALQEPGVAHILSQKIDKYGPLVKEIQDRKKTTAIMNGPGTPQEKARAIVAAGLKVDRPMLEAGYPELAGGVSRATSAGTEQGKADIDLGPAPGVAPPVAGEPTPMGDTTGYRRALFQSQGKDTGEQNAFLRPAPGRPSQTTGGLVAQERAGGARMGENISDTVGGGPAAIAKETPALRDLRNAQAERARRAGATDAPKPADVSTALGRNRSQARAEVDDQIRRIPKEIFAGFKPGEQQDILAYLTAVRMKQLSGQDPVLVGQQFPVPPRPPIMDAFEQRAESGGFGQWLKSLFLGSAPAAATAPPAAAPQAAPAAAPTQQYVEGKLYDASDGKRYRFLNGQMVPQ